MVCVLIEGFPTLVASDGVWWLFVVIGVVTVLILKRLGLLSRYARPIGSPMLDPDFRRRQESRKEHGFTCLCEDCSLTRYEGSGRPRRNPVPRHGSTCFCTDCTR